MRPQPACTSSKIKQQVVFVGQLAQPLQESVGRDANAAFALNRLDENRTGFFVDEFGDGFQIAERRVVETGQQRADAFVVLGLGRGAGGAVGATVEAACEGDDFVAAARRMEPGELDRGFVRFRAGVAEERLAAEASFGEQLRPAALHFGVPRVGDVDQRGDLLLDGFDDSRRTMAEQIAAPAGKEIEISPPLIVPDVGAFAADERHREPLVVWHDVPLEELGGLWRHAGCGGCHSSNSRRFPCRRLRSYRLRAAASGEFGRR